MDSRRPIKTITKASQRRSGARCMRATPARARPQSTIHRVQQRRTAAKRPCKTLELIQGLTMEERRRRLQRLLGADDDPAGRRLVANFQYDLEGLWSMTAAHIALAVCERLRNLPGVTRQWLVVDAFAGVGGNAIQFTQHFDHLIAVELEPARRAMLAANLAMYTQEQARPCNIRVLEGHYQLLTGWTTTTAASTIIFFDPPWGIDYQRDRSITLTVPAPYGPVPLESLVVSAADRATYCVVKLPTNYNMRHFRAAIAPARAVILAEAIYSRPYSTLMVYIGFR